MYEVSVQGHFSAAHNLRGYRGDCERLHGHNWRVRVAVAAGRLDRQGLAVDFRELKRALAAVLGELDHRYLNRDVRDFADGGLNPSTENLAGWIAGRLSAPRLLPKGVLVARVTVWESPGCSATFVGGAGGRRRGRR
jgi:6-pyruvoyltetrahydropterin/6-carboxytetrahydropterin synthase